MSMGQNRFVTFRRGLHAVIGVIAWLAAATLSLMALAIVVNVIGRYVFKRPLQGAVELVELLLVVTVFFSVAYTEVRKGHVTMDEVVSKFPAKVRAIVMAIMYVAAGVFFIVMAWQDTMLGIGYAIPAMRVTDVLKIPIAPFIFVIAFGAVLLGLELVMNGLFPLSSEQGRKEEVLS